MQILPSLKLGPFKASNVQGKARFDSVLDQLTSYLDLILALLLLRYIIIQICEQNLNGSSPPTCHSRMSEITNWLIVICLVYFVPFFRCPWPGSVFLLSR